MIGSVVALVVTFSGWALLHSVFAARSVKAAARRLFGAETVARWYRLAYNVFATITFAPFLLLLVHLPDVTLYIVPAPWRWVLVTVQGAAVVGLVVALRQTDLGAFLGLTQIVHDTPVETESTLRTDGFYRWVRHPLYSFSLLFLWVTPIMTVNLLTTNVLFTLYFYLGSIHEEHRLVAKFGDDYQVYRQQVPRFIPRPHMPESSIVH